MHSSSIAVVEEVTKSILEVIKIISKNCENKYYSSLFGCLFPSLQEAVQVILDNPAININQLLEEEYESDIKLIILKILQQVTSLDDHFITLIIENYTKLPQEVVRYLNHPVPEIAFQALKICGNLFAFDSEDPSLSIEIIEAGFLSKEFTNIKS